MFITRLPEVVFHTRVRDESAGGDNPYRWEDVSSRELFGGRRVVLFALPGAFTPTCSSTHLPRYEALYDAFRAEGVEDIFCLSVNDAFVMFNWGRQLGARQVTLIPDGNAGFTRKMGMLVDKSNLGFGMRSWRYALVADDMRITKAFIEPEYADNCPTDPFTVSDADNVLAWMRGEQGAREPAPRLAFEG